MAGAFNAGTVNRPPPPPERSMHRGLTAPIHHHIRGRPLADSLPRTAFRATRTRVVGIGSSRGARIPKALPAQTNLRGGLHEMDVAAELAEVLVVGP